MSDTHLESNLLNCLKFSGSQGNNYLFKKGCACGFEYGRSHKLQMREKVLENNVLCKISTPQFVSKIRK